MKYLKHSPYPCRTLTHSPETFGQAQNQGCVSQNRYLYALHSLDSLALAIKFLCTSCADLLCRHVSTRPFSEPCNPVSSKTLLWIDFSRHISTQELSTADVPLEFP